MRNTLIEAIIIGLWRTALDRKPDRLSIVNLKDDVYRNLNDSSAKNVLDMRCANVNFDENIKLLEAKLSFARNNFIGHLGRKVHLKRDLKPIKERALSLEDFKELLDLSYRLFSVLSFERHMVLWLWGYGENQRQRKTTDIDRLLYDVARNSFTVNFPDKDPQRWKTYVQKLTDEELTIVNRYRLQFGLPQALR